MYFDLNQMQKLREKAEEEIINRLNARKTNKID